MCQFFGMYFVELNTLFSFRIGQYFLLMFFGCDDWKARDSVRERLTHVESELEDMEMDVQRVLQRDELLREVDSSV